MPSKKNVVTVRILDEDILLWLKNQRRYSSRIYTLIQDDYYKEKEKEKAKAKEETSFLTKVKEGITSSMTPKPKVIPKVLPQITDVKPNCYGSWTPNDSKCKECKVWDNCFNTRVENKYDRE